jgi:hypothetical protein
MLVNRVFPLVFLAGSHERPRSGGASGEFAPLSPRVDPGGGFKAESNRDRAYFARALNRDTNQSARAKITTSIVAASTTSEPVEVQKWARGT